MKKPVLNMERTCKIFGLLSGEGILGNEGTDYRSKSYTNLDFQSLYCVKKHFIVHCLALRKRRIMISS